MADHHYPRVLEDLRDHLNSRMAADVLVQDGELVHGVWTVDDVDVLARALATAPQHVRAGLASILAVPHLTYPDLASQPQED